jgi:hypothetical protein
VLEPEGVEGSAVLRTHQGHVSALAAIAAIRTAERDILLAPETQAAVSAVTGSDRYDRFVNKLHSAA